MSAGWIIHIGSDDCHRVASFRTAGYLVDCCTSFAQLHAALTAIQPADAVAIADGPGELTLKAISLTRATSSAPLILFQSADSQLNAAEFDLVIEVRTDPRLWLIAVQRLIAESRALRARSEALRIES